MKLFNLVLFVTCLSLFGCGGSTKKYTVTDAHGNVHKNLSYLSYSSSSREKRFLTAEGKQIAFAGSFTVEEE